MKELSKINPQDRKLLGILKAWRKGLPSGAKGEKANKEFRELREKAPAGGLDQVLDNIQQSFLIEPEKRLKPSSEEAAGVIRELCRLQLGSSAAMLFEEWKGAFPEAALDQAVSLAPDAKALEIWRKAARVDSKEFEGRLLGIEAVYQTAGADWLLLHTKPQKVIPLLQLFLDRQERPKYLPAWIHALSVALEKNKSGALLAIVLEQFGSDPAKVDALGQAARLTRGSLRVTVEVLPSMLTRKNTSAFTVALIDKVFEASSATKLDERQFVTAMLARLGAGVLMLDRRTELIDAAMKSVDQTVQRLRNTTRDKDLQARTWVIENLQPRESSLDGQRQITTEAARHFAVAFEKAASGFSAKDILSMTAQNLGMIEVGLVGEQVAYDPLLHEDIEGGLLPKDIVRVEEQGWAYDGETFVRAKVRKVEEIGRV